MSSEQVSFSVAQTGSPVLAGEGEEAPLPDDLAEATPAPLLPGWTAEEAAQMVASIFTTGVLVAYVARWAGMPDPELWPYLAATKSEFPQTGAGLVPLLDRFLPQGTAGGIAAAGVGLLAGVGEVAIAGARRVKVVTTVGPKGREAVPAGAPEPARPAAATTEGGSYKLPRELAQVVEQRSAYADFGMAA